MSIIGDEEPSGTREECVKALLKETLRSQANVPMNSRQTSVTGLQLHDRFVSHMEIRNLLRIPPLTARQLRIVELYFGEECTNEEVSRRLGWSRETVIAEKRLAVQEMIRALWQEPSYTTPRRIYAATATATIANVG